MRKSVYVVGGIGGIGCLLLSFMMQHLLKVHTDRSRSPIAAEIDETCGACLETRADVLTQLDNGELTMIVRMRVKPDVDREAFARSVIDLVWRRAHVLTQPPERLRIEVRDSPGSTPLVVQARPPGLERPRTSRARAPATTRTGAPDAAPGSGSTGTSPARPLK